MSVKSPLKGKPLRVAGESVDEAIDRWITDSAIAYYLAAAQVKEDL